MKRNSGSRFEGERDIVAIDGKALRGSHDQVTGLGPLFLVSAWAVQRGLSLGQLASVEKSNEFTAIPQLLDQIDISQFVVTIDAADIKKGIATKIIDGNGNHVLSLKGNQGKLYDAIIDYITIPMGNNFSGMSIRKQTEKLKGHGREDELTHYQLPIPPEWTGRVKWKGVKTIGVVIRMSQKRKKFTSDVR
jgi:predicted transposase YbfD/YdcC